MDNKSFVTKKIESIDTKELEGILLSSKKSNSVLSDNKDYFVDEDKKFSYYMKDLIKEKGLTIRDVVFKAGLSENYGRKIISQEKQVKNRDVIIRICISALFTIDEMNRALKLYGMKALYAKDKRDAVIMIEVNKGNKTVEDIDDVLLENGLKILSSKLNDD